MHLVIALNDAVGRRRRHRCRGEADRLFGPFHSRVDVFALHPEVLVEVERHAERAVPARVKTVLEVRRGERPAEPDVDAHGFVVLSRRRDRRDEYQEERRQ